VCTGPVVPLMTVGNAALVVCAASATNHTVLGIPHHRAPLDLARRLRRIPCTVVLACMLLLADEVVALAAEVGTPGLVSVAVALVKPILGTRPTGTSLDAAAWLRSTPFSVRPAATLACSNELVATVTLINGAPTIHCFACGHRAMSRGYRLTAIPDDALNLITTVPAICLAYT
jgi:hypothetical protein